MRSIYKVYKKSSNGEAEFVFLSMDMFHLRKLLDGFGRKLLKDPDWKLSDEFNFAYRSVVTSTLHNVYN